MGNLKKLIAKIRNTKDYENLDARLYPNLGKLIRKLIDEAELMDKELDLLHGTMTQLYENDKNVPEIKSCLDKIQELQKHKIDNPFMCAMASEKRCSNQCLSCFNDQQCDIETIKNETNVLPKTI
jgi:DNA replication initiation complex subunit (GINS family)